MQQHNRPLSLIFLSVVSLQALISLIQFMSFPSQEENAVLLGYSPAHLLIAALLATILLLSLSFLITTYLQRTPFLNLFPKQTASRVFMVLLVGSLGMMVFMSSILIVVSDNINSEGHTIYFSTLSLERLIVHAIPFFIQIKLYLLKLLPLLRWGLAFGISTLLYLFWGYSLQNSSPSKEHQPKRNQVHLVHILVALSFSLVTLAIYFPQSRPFMLRSSTLYDWLFGFTLVAGLSLLISLVYYSKLSLRAVMLGVVSLGLIFNWVEHTYNPSRLELSRRPSNTLESFLDSPNEQYHFRENPIYLKLSRDYAGKEVIINPALMDEFSISEMQLIVFGRLSKVTFTEDMPFLTEDAARELLGLPYEEVWILDKSRLRHEDTKWVFIETGLQEAGSVLVKKAAHDLVFVYPANLQLLSEGQNP